MPLSTQTRDFRQGIRVATPRLSLIANATPLEFYRMPGAAAAGGATTVGQRTAILRKLTVTNLNAAATVVTIGYNIGGGLVAVLDIPLAAGPAQVILTEDQLPDFEFFASLIAQASVAGAAPNDVRVIGEVEEFLGGQTPS